MKKLSALIISLVLLSIPTVTLAAPNKPVYATIQQVQQMIADALAPINSLLSNHEERLDNLEALSSPTPTINPNAVPPVKYMKTIVFSENPMHIIIEGYGMSNEQLNDDVFWGYVTIDGQQLRGEMNSDRIKVYIPSDMEPVVGETVEVDTYLHWGGVTKNFKFNHLWSSTSKQYTSENFQ